MTAAVACKCGAVLVPANDTHPEAPVCPHCDFPCLKGGAKRERCRRVNGPEFR